MKKRVVVTGLGVITPIGNNVETYWKNLLDGVCGIDYIKSIPTDDLPVKIAGEVKDFNPADYEIEAGFARKQDKFTIYAVAAAYQAVKQAGLSSSEEGNIDPFRFGVYVGSGVGGFSTIMRESEKILKEGPKWVSPLFIPTMISNIAAGNIAIRNNACGPCLPVVTACATSTHAIGEAFRAIKHGYADAIIAGGTEAAVIPISIAGFANAKALSRAEDPKYASLPFNKNRGGFVMGEGAAMLILEEFEHAKARGAEIICEITGYGNTCDAYHVTAPRPDGKTQVTVEYDDNGVKRIDTVLISTQHDPDVTQEQIREDLINHVIKAIIPAELLDEETKYFTNPTGRFVIGGPHGDSGLTGRKIIVDTYGGYARHGGGAFSGKDPTKVDRSATYAARYAAKNVVAAGLADKCEIQLAYAIGVAKPVSILVDTFGTGKLADEEIALLVEKNFDLRPAAIIRDLDLRRPIYRQTAAYGHFGRTDVDLPWEHTDKAEALRQ